jgi:O-antigen/teichoic acid export membrane protein
VDALESPASDETERAYERNRRYAWSSTTAIAARVISLAVSFVTLPLILNYLGTERYGMWLTITSVVAIMGPLDLGVGNGLRQFLSHASGRDDQATSTRAVSTATALLTLVAALVLAAIPVLLLQVPWGDIYNVSGPVARDEAGATTMIVVAAFAIGLPLGLVNIVQGALQIAYVSSVWAIAGALASVIALLLAIATAASLPVLAVALTGTGLAAAALNWVVYFRGRGSWLAPRLGLYDRSLAGTLLGTGMIFLILQVASLIGYQIDNIVIANILGAAAVPGYAIPMRLFMVVPMLVSLALAPLWPAYREAIARGDTAWVRRTLRRSTLVTFVATAGSSLFLVVTGDTIIHIWVGDSISPSTALLVGLGLWAIAYSMSNALAMLMNAADAIRVQAVLATLMAVSNALISIALVQRIGIVGAVAGSLIAQVLFILIPFAIYVPRIVRGLDRDDVATTQSDVTPPP